MIIIQNQVNKLKLCWTMSGHPKVSDLFNDQPPQEIVPTQHLGTDEPAAKKARTEDPMMSCMMFEKLVNLNLVIYTFHSLIVLN